MTATILHMSDYRPAPKGRDPLINAIDRIFVDLDSFGRLAGGQPRENNLRPDSTPIVHTGVLETRERDDG